MGHQDTEVTFCGGVEEGVLPPTVLFPQPPNFSHCANPLPCTFTDAHKHTLISQNCFVHKVKINKYVWKSLYVISGKTDKRRSLSCQARKHIDFQSWMLLSLSAASLSPPNLQQLRGESKSTVCGDGCLLCASSHVKLE